MTVRKEYPDLSSMDKHLLDWLNRKLPQDKNWLDTFEERLKKLERRKLVTKSENLWSLTPLGQMFAVMQEGRLP